MADQDVMIKRGEDVVLRTKSGRISARVIPMAAILDRSED